MGTLTGEATTDSLNAADSPVPSNLANNFSSIIAVIGSGSAEAATAVSSVGVAPCSCCSVGCPDVWELQQFHGLKPQQGVVETFVGLGLFNSS
ncbi:hypothetical protein OROHE_008681 [Orobanche hederae]